MRSDLPHPLPILDDLRKNRQEAGWQKQIHDDSKPRGRRKFPEVREHPTLGPATRICRGVAVFSVFVPGGLLMTPDRIRYFLCSWVHRLDPSNPNGRQRKSCAVKCGKIDDRKREFVPEAGILLSGVQTPPRCSFKGCVVCGDSDLAADAWWHL
jgi:hypothetical protein